MVSDCVGIKASAGQFFLRPGSVTLRTDGSGVLLKFVVEKVALNALSVRVRPNVGNPAALCNSANASAFTALHRMSIRSGSIRSLTFGLQGTCSRACGQSSSSALNLAPLQNDPTSCQKHG